MVVTHAFWERQLGSDPNVSGGHWCSTGHPYTVIGVLPRGFRPFGAWGFAVAVPAGRLRRAAAHHTAEGRRYELLGLLAPGQSPAEFRARVAARGEALEAPDPLDNDDLGRVQTFPFHPLGLFLSADDQMMQMLLLFASVVVVLVLLLAVVACVNVAGLLVARAVARQREFAVRISIGCGRWRLARLLLAESLLLAIAGVGLGAVASIWLARVLVAVPLPFPVPFEVEVPLDLHLLAYLATLVGLATLVVGVAPVLQAFRVSVVGGGIGGAPRPLGHRRWSARGVLISVQVAVSTSCWSLCRSSSGACGSPAASIPGSTSRTS